MLHSSAKIKTTTKSRSISSADIESFEQEEIKRAQKAEELRHSAVVLTKKELMGNSADEAKEKEKSTRRRRSQSVDLTPQKDDKPKRRQRRRNSLKRGFQLAKECTHFPLLLFNAYNYTNSLTQVFSASTPAEDKEKEKEEKEKEKDRKSVV